MTGYQTRYAPNPIAYGAPRYRPSLAQYAATDPRLQGPSFIPATRTESRGLVESPMSDEMFALLINGENSRKTRALRTAADIKRAEDERNFLDSITANESAGIFDAPGSERESRLQELLNRDYMARDRGSRLSMAGKAWNEEIARKMAPYYLDVAQFREGAKDREQRRELQKLQLEGLQDYRGQQVQLRQQAQQGLQDYRGQSLAQREQQLANRAANDQFNREFRQRQAETTNARADANQIRNSFNDWMRGAQTGISVGNLEASLSAMEDRLTPAQLAQGRGVLAKLSQAGSVAESLANNYSNLVIQEAGRLAAQKGGTIADHMDTAGVFVQQEVNKNPQARGTIFFDGRRFSPNDRFNRSATTGMSGGSGIQSNGGGGGGGFSDAISPTPSSYVNSLAGAPDGTYFDRESGFAYRVVNGQPQKMNRRVPQGQMQGPDEVYGPPPPPVGSREEAEYEFYGPNPPAWMSMREAQLPPQPRVTMNWDRLRDDMRPITAPISVGSRALRTIAGDRYNRTTDQISDFINSLPLYRYAQGTL